MASGTGISDLLQCAVLKNVEYGDAVVLQTMRCVEPPAVRMDVDVSAASGIHFISLNLLHKSEHRCAVVIGDPVCEHISAEFGDTVHKMTVLAEFHMSRAAAGRAFEVFYMRKFDLAVFFADPYQADHISSEVACKDESSLTRNSS